MHGPAKNKIKAQLLILRIQFQFVSKHNLFKFIEFLST